MPQRLEYRAIFISDTHLGSRGCRAKELSDFLKHVRCQRLYLVGDIIDMWRLRQRWHWPAEHNDVARKILKMAKHATEVLYIPGNHDEHARDYLGLAFGDVQIVPHAEHVTADGRRLYVTHGDQFDMVVKHHRLLSMLGARAYDWLISVNRLYNAARRMLGLKYWSLSKYIKGKVKSACTYVAKFEQTLMDEARRKGYDAVVCGHIHKPEIDRSGPIAYYNCGDWIEHCTALVEHDDGTLQIIDAAALVEQLQEQKKAAKELLGRPTAETPSRASISEQHPAI